MSRYVSTSPHFFRPVRRAFWGGLSLLLAMAALIPAPLEVAADPAHPPNPAKSAWFLLWIQELVSYHTLAIHAVLALACLLLALPWLPIRAVASASWLQRDHRPLGVFVLFVCLSLLALTATGLFFRGTDWRLVSPF